MICTFELLTLRTSARNFGLALMGIAVLLAGQMATAQQPNIVLINLDDADRDMFSPQVLNTKFPVIGELARQGLTFTNFHVCSPKCGPSRACLMRGQYAHVIGIRTNEPDGKANRGFTGGFPNFMDAGYFDDDFGRWMKRAGYQTVFVGKYMNGTTRVRVPPGWDHFYLARGSEYYRTHRFTNRNPDKPRFYTTPDGLYRTDVEVDDIVRIINDELSSQKPFLIYFAPFGPHTEGNARGGMVAHELADKWPNIKQPRRPDYNEKNNRDKPIAYRQLPPLSFADELELEVLYRKRMLAVKSIDQGIGRILAALKTNRLDENTYVFVTSDNGYSLGQHRFRGKGKSLSRSCHVPLIVTGPGIAANRKNGELTSQIDLAPTFLELAGAGTKPFFDGQSLVPLLLENRPINPGGFREALLVENWESSRINPYVLNTTFTQLRTLTESYTEWADGSVEYYDLLNDPLELNNRAGGLSVEAKAGFRQKMDRLRRPLPEPICTIESPETDFQEFPGSPFDLKGVAESSHGVQKVDLVIRNRQNGKYWNGNDWQQSRITVSPQLANPNGILCEWSYRFDPPEPANPRESYLLVARAWSARGAVSRTPSRRKFKYDSLLPVTRLKNPRVRSDRSVIMWGNASDNVQVRHVTLVIQDRTNGHFFNGRGWQPDRASVKIVPDANGDWEWRMPPIAAGKYIVRARSTDTAGNYEPTPESMPFEVR